MPKFKFRIERTITRQVEIVVEGKDLESAWNKAEEKEGDIDFTNARETEPEYNSAFLGIV